MLRRNPHLARVRRRTLLAGIALFLLSGWLLVPAVGSELRQTPLVRAVQAARPVIVNIKGEKTIAEDADDGTHNTIQRRVNGMGTGVIVDPRGYVLTNYHVVAGVREIHVTLADRREFTARLIDHHLETDLAIIKIDDCGKLPVICVGTSSDLMPGETVVAVGNAYGYEHTVTRGIISALHRAVQVSDAQYYADLIQTDASINPGNSGGPLLNIDGEMIGLNVAVRAGAQGIGFAIPVDKAMGIAAKLVAKENARNIWHGVALADDPSSTDEGVRVAEVAENSPAAEAGLKVGDEIAAVGENPVADRLGFHCALLERKPGDQVELLIRRDGDSLEMPLSLADVPRAPEAWSVLGLDLKAISADEFERCYKTRYRGGLLVHAVRSNSPAALQGITPGDVLVGMHVWETVSPDNVAYVLKRSDFETFNPVKFFILRDGETLYGYMPVSSRTARRP